jgi:3-oxoacyl-[acyl-carrier-protein] synthase-3
MKFDKVRITATAVVQPPVELTSAAIEASLEPVYQRLGLPAGRLELMSGIHARHFWEQPIQPSAAAAQAGEQLLSETALDRREIDLLIFCGVCRDRMEPATAAYVHGLLGLSPNCQILDVSNACLGFANGMVLAGGLIESGNIRHALLVSGENGKPLLDHTLQHLLAQPLNRRQIKPYFANLTIGAGAAAMLVSHADATTDCGDSEHGIGILRGAVVRTDSASNELCQGDTAGSEALQMLTEAEALLDAGIALATTTWERFRQQMAWPADAPDLYVCHQVGRSHQRRLFEALGADRSKDFTTFETMGNVGSVSLPFTLHRALREGKIIAGSRVAMLGIGSGLSCMMLGVEWSV